MAPKAVLATFHEAVVADRFGNQMHMRRGDGEVTAMSRIRNHFHRLDKTHSRFHPVKNQLAEFSLIAERIQLAQTEQPN